MRKNKLFFKAMFVCILPLALLSCSNDDESAPGVPENGIKGLATVNALSVSVSGSFGGVSKIDLSLGKTGVLFCLKNDNAASVFQAWLNGDKKAECYEYTDGRLTSDTYSGTISNLYPDKDYNYCLFSVSRDGKTFKMSDVYTFHTGQFEPEFKNFKTDSIRYTKAVVKGRITNVVKADASGCSSGVLFVNGEGGEVDSDSKKYEAKSSKTDMRILTDKLASDSDYCCRPYVKYITHDSLTHYVYGPSLNFRTWNLDDWGVDLGLPSGIRWSQCEMGREDFDDVTDYLFGNRFYVCWGSLDAYYNVLDYEYYDENTGYIDIGDNISGTQYDIAHVRLGGHWRMPTKDDVEELMENCNITYSSFEKLIPYGSSYATWSSTEFYLTSKINSNSIKSYPASYWTGTMSDEANCPYLMSLSINHAENKNQILQILKNSRDYDWLIRPVWDPKFNN